MAGAGANTGLNRTRHFSGLSRTAGRILREACPASAKVARMLVEIFEKHQPTIKIRHARRGFDAIDCTQLAQKQEFFAVLQPSRIESNRVLRRLQFLRKWSHEQEQQVFP